jgi:hypothetical protein
LDNNGLMKTKKDVEQFVSFKFNENVIILPPRIWSAFTKWYGRTQEIKREVVEYSAH